MSELSILELENKLRAWTAILEEQILESLSEEFLTITAEISAMGRFGSNLETAKKRKKTELEYARFCIELLAFTEKLAPKNSDRAEIIRLIRETLDSSAVSFRNYFETEFERKRHSESIRQFVETDSKTLFDKLTKSAEKTLLQIDLHFASAQSLNAHSGAVTRIRVFIASPGDTGDERLMVKQALDDWNSAHSEKENTIVQPVRWERDSFPDSGDSAQNLIDQQVLESCDLLIAIFKHRFGTPTETHKSGTEQEIDHHLQAGKKAMIYFCSMQPDFSKVDKHQYELIEEFKMSALVREKIKYENYESATGLKDQLNLQISEMLNKNFLR